MAVASPYLLCFFLLLLWLPYVTIAQSHKNISLGASLTAQNHNSSWASPSGEFAFGFQQIGKGGFLLAIWFDSIPEKTVVWSANGNNLVQRGSKIELTTDGRFVLEDSNGKKIWGADSAGSGVAYAAMLNTGNFVLAGQDSVNLWESFNEPTDTILPTQTMQEGGRLVARYSETNYSRGRFQLPLQTDGNFVLYNTHFPLDSVDSAYWSTQIFGTDFQVIYNQSGSIYVKASNGTIISQVLSGESSTKDFHRRAILEYDGVFRQYVYPKTAGSSSGRWPMEWTTVSYIPGNICTRLGRTTGIGACGYNSYCRLGDDQRPKCQCPSGYTLLDPTSEMNGCKQNFASQSCDGGGATEIDQFDFQEIINTDWMDSDYEHFQQVDEDWCREACLGDCLCAVAIFREANCWKKKIPLSYGRTDPGVGGKALIKVRKGNSTSKVAGGGSKTEDQSTLILTGSVLLGSSVFLNLLLLVATLLIIFNMNRRKKMIPQPYQVVPGTSLQRFTYEELEKATDGFKEELGRGAFGIVYKGEIQAFQNQEIVAVKKLDKMVGEREQEFKTEVSSIGRINHRNLVQLLGYCNEGQHRLLVYEFMSQGSLGSFLFGNSRPNWHRRIQIACGTARGLLYLHEECRNQIIHCDIKPQNILLDESFTAKLSDFGLAKLLKADQTRTLTGIRGTKGYVAPEWFKSMPITVKVDVYSFGILLLELICCRKNFEGVKDEDQMILCDWAYDSYREGRLDRLVESDEEAQDDMKRVEKFVMTAIWCIQDDPSLRPTMKKVTQMLEGAIQVPVPPDPSSFTILV